MPKSDNKDHIHPKRPPPLTAVQQSGSDAILQAYVETEVMQSKQEVMVKKTEQLKMYLTMLSNPNMPAEGKNAITAPSNSLAMDLEREQSAGSSSGNGGDSSGGGARTQVLQRGGAGLLPPRQPQLESPPAGESAGRAARDSAASLCRILRPCIS